MPRRNFVDLDHAPIADQPVVAFDPAQPGAQRRTRQPRIAENAEVGGVPAARGLQAEGGIAGCSVMASCSTASARSAAIRSVGADQLDQVERSRPAGPVPRRIQSVHLQQAPHDRTHGGQHGVLRFAHLQLPRFSLAHSGKAMGAAGEAIRLLDRDSTRIEQATEGGRTKRTAQRIAPDRKKSAPATRRWLAGGVVGSGRPATGKIAA
jgi:hypothetical protein